MTLSEGAPPYKTMEWSNVCVNDGRKEIRSTSSTSGSSLQQNDSSFDTALDCLDPERRPMNLVLKARFSKPSSHRMIRHRDSDLLRRRQLRPPKIESARTERTQSFTTHSSDVLVEEKAQEEAMAVTDDDGRIEQDNLKEEEVYKHLSALAIVPPDPDETVPRFVSTPDRSKRKSTPATSTSSSPTHNAKSTPVVEDVNPCLDCQEEESSDADDNDSVLSDITGLTGVCTRFSTTGGANGNTDVVADSSIVPQSQSPPELLISIDEDKKKPTMTTRSSLVPTLPVEQQVKSSRRWRQFGRPAAFVQQKVPPSRRRRKVVSFSTVCIREYERILGDNPSCSNGPSLGIGWDFDGEEVLSIDEWEGWRETEREPDRLVLCREEREEILLDLGYGPREIAQAVREIVKVKNKRRQTIHNMSASGVEELVESAGKKVKSIRNVKVVKNLFGRKHNVKKHWDDEESICA